MKWSRVVRDQRHGEDRQQQQDGGKGIGIDGKYVDSVVRQFGNYKQHRMKTFPNLTFARLMKYVVYNRIKKIRPIYWMDYRKEDAKKLLTEQYDWEWYGGHHLENRFTAFLHSYYAPRRFGLDTRVVGHSGLVRSGQMIRAEAIERLRANPRVAVTDKQQTNVVFSFGRDHGYYGRILSQTVVSLPTLAVRRKRELYGFCFTPQDGNSLLSSVAAALWLIDPDRASVSARLEPLRQWLYQEV